MPENLVMTSAYAGTFVRTLGEVVGVGLEWLAIIRRGIKLDNPRFSVQILVKHPKKKQTMHNLIRMYPDALHLQPAQMRVQVQIHSLQAQS